MATLKEAIMATVNELCDLLYICDDESFVDEACMRVSCCDPFYIDIDEE